MTISKLIELLKTLPNNLYFLLETCTGEILPAGIKMTHRKIDNSKLHSRWVIYSPENKEKEHILLDFIHKKNITFDHPDIQIINSKFNLGDDILNGFFPEHEGNIEHVSIRKAKHLYNLSEVIDRALQLEKRVTRLNCPEYLIYQYIFPNRLNLIKNTLHTTIFSGIGLNKEVINLGTRQILPGEAVIVSTLTEKGKSYCDFSISRGNRIKAPKKYTKLLLKLRQSQ